MVERGQYHGQRLKAQEVLRRYAAGERDFRGAILRGCNFRGADLSEADFSGADIRGTNFTDATLVSAKFIEAKAGVQRRWFFPQLLVAIVLAALASLIAGAVWGVLAHAVFAPNASLIDTEVGDRVAGVLGLLISLGALGLLYWRGVVATVVAVAVAVAVAGAVAIAGAFAVAVAGAVAIAGAGATILTSFLISRRALLGDPRDQLVRDIAVWFSSKGGTRFIRANLTDATFEKAILKSTHFYQATLTRTCFHLSKKLNLACLGKTIPANFTVQQLLVTLRGSHQSFVGLNIRGAYLVGADLTQADLTEADLSQATLEKVALTRANLTKTQALGVCFHQADLTGATLEAWNIDSTTRLEEAICDYVYLLNHQQERRPNSSIFHPGEFTKLFQEVLDTVDLIFQNGIDWKAFIRTFQQVQVQYEEAELSVQSIENKGDGVVVIKLNAAPGTDKSAVRQHFMEGYQTALKEAEARYKAQLDAKDEQIVDYRQQNANMQEVVKLLASRPVTVDVKTDVKAIAESKSMQGDDYSRNVSAGGEVKVTGSTLNLGEIGGQVSNQINQLPDTAPGTDKPSLKELLTQLKDAVEQDTELSEIEKKEALGEVAKLAEAGGDPQAGAMQRMAKRAMDALKSITEPLSDASKLATACKTLLPIIVALF